MGRWLHSSVRVKLMAVTMATCLAALLLAGAAIVTYELVTARSSLAVQLVSRADLIGSAATAAVQFRDDAAALETLSAFRGDTEVDAARIDLSDGTHLALYEARPSRIPDRPPRAGIENVGGTMIVSRRILLDGQPIGSIHVQGSLAGVYAQVLRYLWILMVVLAASSLLAYALSSALQSVISGPIVRLAEVAAQVSTGRNYAVRAVRETDDELGELVTRFNEMLDQIEQRDEALQSAQSLLEARVLERTEKLEREIVEHRRTENEFILAKAAAEEANRAKSAFLANMSHELRTPLNAIIGYSELLIEQAQGQLSDGAVRDLSRVKAAGRHLLALITDVLDISKIEAGRMEIEIETFDVSALLHGVVTTSQSLAATRSNELSLVEDGDLGEMSSDQTKLRQVLLNLVGNACKFTERGTVRIIARRETGAAREWLVLEVADTGVGMSREQVKRLFADFVQVDATSTRRYGGSGLGLAISQRLCKLLGGEITVESEFGRGSRFTVRLPASVPAPVERTPAAIRTEAETPIAFPLPAGGPAERVWEAVVLVIDDDETTVDLATRALERGRFRTEHAASGKEGLELIERLRPDLVLLDLLLPDTSGWTLLTQMRKIPESARIPVIVVSVMDNRRRSLELGANSHLVKPVAPDQLVRAVQAALNPAAASLDEAAGPRTKAAGAEAG